MKKIRFKDLSRPLGFRLKTYALGIYSIIFFLMLEYFEPILRNNLEMDSVLGGTKLILTLILIVIAIGIFLLEFIIEGDSK